MSKWFTEASLPKPTGDWRWRIGMLSSRPILQILVRRESRPPTAAWLPAPLIKFAPFLNRPRESVFEYCWRDINLQDLSSAVLRPLMSGRRPETTFGPYPAVRSGHATILVNGKPHTVPERPHTVADIVDLAYGQTPDGISTDTVTVTVRDRGMDAASIVPSGAQIEVHDGLILNVVTADSQAPH